MLIVQGVQLDRLDEELEDCKKLQIELARSVVRERQLNEEVMKDGSTK